MQVLLTKRQEIRLYRKIFESIKESNEEHLVNLCESYYTVILSPALLYQ